MSKRTARKTAIITGAAQRIGAAITRELHRRGMDVVIHFNASARAAGLLAKELNAERRGSAHLLRADLGKPDSYPALIQSAHGINKRLDVLINNAAVFYPTPLNKITARSWDEVMNVNLKAPLFLAQAAAPYLKKNMGCIINLTDIHALRTLKNHTIYSVSKAALVMLTRCLARELAPSVRVNAIAPGAILWPEHIPEEEQKAILERIPLRRTGTLDDISRAVRYLVEDAQYTTGQVLVIDGGRSLDA